MLKLMGKKINTILGKLFLLNWPYEVTSQYNIVDIVLNKIVIEIAISYFSNKTSYFSNENIGCSAYWCLVRVPTSSGNHGKPGKSRKKIHVWKNHGI